MLKRKNIKVLIVDDSAVVCAILLKALNQSPDIDVVGTAKDALEAQQKIDHLKPDVLTLDIAMPQMDGLTFLKILMKKNPLPVIVVSSLTIEGSTIAIEAIENGAVDVINKPDNNISFATIVPQLIHKVKAAASAKISTSPSFQSYFPSPKTTLSPFDPTNNRQLIFLGASTGGTEALKHVLLNMPEHIPGICVVQHIPPVFSAAFAKRLDTLCPFKVKEADDGDIVKPNLVLVAPGDFHMALKQRNGQYYVELNQDPVVWYQRPAVDILFKSASEIVDPSCAAALFTGMGKDGAEGLLALRKRGVRTFAQDETTCVVYGMPKAAHDIGAAEEMVPLPQMASVLIQSLKQKKPGQI